jgi:hypothetical protein
MFKHPSFPTDVEIGWFKESAGDDADAVSSLIDEHAMTQRGIAKLAMVRGC